MPPFQILGGTLPSLSQTGKGFLLRFEAGKSCWFRFARLRCYPPWVMYLPEPGRHRTKLICCISAWDRDTGFLQNGPWPFKRLAECPSTHVRILSGVRGEGKPQPGAGGKILEGGGARCSGVLDVVPSFFNIIQASTWLRRLPAIS